LRDDNGLLHVKNKCGVRKNIGVLYSCDKREKQFFLKLNIKLKKYIRNEQKQKA